MEFIKGISNMYRLIQSQCTDAAAYLNISTINLMSVHKIFSEKKPARNVAIALEVGTQNTNRIFLIMRKKLFVVVSAFFG